MNERDKDICDVRAERDNLAMLLRRLIYSNRNSGIVTQTTRNILERAEKYMTKHGLSGEPIKKPKGYYAD